MEWWHVYLFTRLDGTQTLFQVVALVLGMTIAIIGAMSPMIAEDLGREEKTCFFRWLKIGAGVFCVSTLLALAIPTQKEAAAIYLLPKLANSDFAKEAGQIPTDAAKLMRLKLEAWIAEMEPAAAKK